MHDLEAWPALPLDAWSDTYKTLHMWPQIVGKIRLKLTPHLNHWWEVPFYLTSRGLTTTPIARQRGASFGGVTWRPDRPLLRAARREATRCLGVRSVRPRRRSAWATARSWKARTMPSTLGFDKRFH